MRLSWVDIAKGIGIMLVVLGHTNARLLFDGYAGWWINGFHMPLFFVMAGLCFDVKRYPNFGRYVLRKVKALGWPYFALSTFMAAVSVGLYLGTDPRWSFWGQVRPFLTCGSRVNTFWFIKTLFEVEIVFWLVARFVRRPMGILGVTVVCAGVGAFVVPAGEQVMKYNTFLVSLFYYALGYLTKDAVKEFAEKGSSLLWGVGLVAVGAYSVLIAYCFHYTVGYWGCLLGNEYLFFPLSLLAIFGVSVLSMAMARVPYVCGTFVWLGVNSIVLMAIHGHCGIFRTSWGENGFGGLLSIIAEYALFAILAWALAGPLNFLVKFPWRKV